MAVGLWVTVMRLVLAAVRISKGFAAENAFVFAIKIIVITVGALSHEETLGRLVKKCGGKGDEADVANGVSHE